MVPMVMRARALSAVVTSVALIAQWAARGSRTRRACQSTELSVDRTVNGQPRAGLPLNDRQPSAQTDRRCAHVLPGGLSAPATAGEQMLGLMRTSVHEGTFGHSASHDIPRRLVRAGGRVAVTDHR
jgi:hypothetical protein